MNTWLGVRLEVTSVANGLDLHRLDEGLHHRQGHVRLEQRHAHLAQGIGDVVFGDAAATAQGIDGAGEPRCQVVEHGRAL